MSVNDLVLIGSTLYHCCMRYVAHICDAFLVRYANTRTRYTCSDYDTRCSLRREQNSGRKEGHPSTLHTQCRVSSVCCWFPHVVMWLHVDLTDGDVCGVGEAGELFKYHKLCRTKCLYPLHIGGVMFVLHVYIYETFYI
jgi:hypothetical protein